MRLVALALVLAACSPSPAPNSPDAVAVRQLAMRACVAKGEVQIAMDRLQAVDCAETTAKLQHLVREDQDCLVYFGDAGVAVKDICEGSSTGGPR